MLEESSQQPVTMFRHTHLKAAKLCLCLAAADMEEVGRAAVAVSLMSHPDFEKQAEVPSPQVGTRCHPRILKKLQTLS